MKYRGMAFVWQITSLASHTVFAVVFTLAKLKCKQLHYKEKPLFSLASRFLCKPLFPCNPTTVTMAGIPFRPPPLPPFPPDFGFPSGEQILPLTKLPPLLSSSPRTSFVPHKFSTLGSPWTLPSLPTGSSVSSALLDLPPSNSTTTALPEQISVTSTVETPGHECSSSAANLLVSTGEVADMTMLNASGVNLLDPSSFPALSPSSHPPANTPPIAPSNPQPNSSNPQPNIPPLPANWANNLKKTTDKSLKKQNEERNSSSPPAPLAPPILAAIPTLPREDIQQDGLPTGQKSLEPPQTVLTSLPVAVDTLMVDQFTATMNLEPDGSIISPPSSPTCSPSHPSSPFPTNLLDPQAISLPSPDTSFVHFNPDNHLLHPRKITHLLALPAVHHPRPVKTSTHGTPPRPTVESKFSLSLNPFACLDTEPPSPPPSRTPPHPSANCTDTLEVYLSMETFSQSDLADILTIDIALS
ncbi:hypothetical protein YC2023_095630 [Brassica napus]